MDSYKLQEGTIKCPHCGELVPINSTLHKQLAETLQAELKKDSEVKLLEERNGNKGPEKKRRPKWRWSSKPCVRRFRKRRRNLRRPAGQSSPYVVGSGSLRNGRKDVNWK